MFQSWGRRVVKLDFIFIFNILSHRILFYIASHEQPTKFMWNITFPWLTLYIVFYENLLVFFTIGLHFANSILQLGLVGLGGVWSRKSVDLFPLQLITVFCVNCCDVDAVLQLHADGDNATQKNVLSSHSAKTVIDSNSLQ